MNEDDFWITDLGPLRFVNFDFEGNLKYTWLVPQELPDGYIEVHSFSVDPEGNLYGGDNQYGRTQKFVPKPGANPELLINPPCENWWLPDETARPLTIEAAESPNALPDSAMSVRKVIDDFFIENRGGKLR